MNVRQGDCYLLKLLLILGLLALSPAVQCLCLKVNLVLYPICGAFFHQLANFFHGILFKFDTQNLLLERSVLEQAEMR